MHEQTFDDVYRKLARPLLKYIARVTGDGSLAEDLLQKAFFRLLEASPPPMDERQMKNYVFKSPKGEMASLRSAGNSSATGTADATTSNNSASTVR